MATTTISQQGVDRFTPSAHETIRAAQREALRMQATNVTPEHLLLAVVKQGDERAISLLSRLGMDVPTMRQHIATLSQGSENRALEEGELPLSKEAQECVEWALCFTAYMHASSVFPDHLLLGVLRHPRTQPLLSFLLPQAETLQTRISEELGPAYTCYIDQLTQSRIRDQSVVNYPRGISQRVLRKFERPIETFADIADLDSAKHVLRDVVEFLKATPTYQLSGGRFPHGVLLTGSTLNERRLLVRATAGEAVVPLITFSMPALVEILTDLSSGAMRVTDLELPGREYNLFRRGDVPEKGQRYIQYIFQEVKDVAPAILYIEDIDALSRLGKSEGQELVLRQLLSEMDALDKHYRTIPIACADRPADIDPALLKAGRFENQVVLDRGSNVQTAVQKAFCSSCRREVQPEWQHCTYCGVSLARSCAHCGSPYPEIAGARFCPSCGWTFV